MYFYSPLICTRVAAYILMFRAVEEMHIDVGSLGRVHIPEGFYAYVGSARRGLRHRLMRHMTQTAHPHWHIDYLWPREVTGFYVVMKNAEYEIAQHLCRRLEYIKGFGSTDSPAESHLFHSREYSTLDQEVLGAISGMEYIRATPEEVLSGTAPFLNHS